MEDLGRLEVQIVVTDGFEEVARQIFRHSLKRNSQGEHVFAVKYELLGVGVDDCSIDEIKPAEIVGKVAEKIDAVQVVAKFQPLVVDAQYVIAGTARGYNREGYYCVTVLTADGEKKYNMPIEVYEAQFPKSIYRRS